MNDTNKRLEEIEENRLEDMSANLVESSAKERDEAQDSPSPVKYDPGTHRDIFTNKVRQRCGLELNEEQADGIATAYEEMQLENVQIAMSQGFGLAAFFPEHQRVQIKKSVQLRIEQLVIMLGDAFIQKQMQVGGPEIAKAVMDSVGPTRPVNPVTRQLALDAEAEFTDGSGAAMAILMLIDAFPVLPKSTLLPGGSRADFDPGELWKWARNRNSSQRDAMLFCLFVWNSDGDWPKFDLHRAWGNWDASQRGVVQGWLDRPWWP